MWVEIYLVYESQGEISMKSQDYNQDQNQT